VVQLGNGIKEDDLLFHDEKAREPSLAYLLSRMRYPDFPEPMGVFRCVDAPIYEQAMIAQEEKAIAKEGVGTLEALLDAGDTWVVEK
jgi:2-oxoglutarate ferredoxin oxidoreductase subunit beta